MPRLYLIISFFIVSFVSNGQVKTKKLIEFADQQFKKGDYIYAIDYYQQALIQDSNSLELQWKYAEVQRAYKNYVAAEEYYAKVFARDDAKIFPASALYLGLMQKQNANYTKAFETFKLAKRKYEKDKNSYLYKKAVQEIDATAWAIKNYSDTLKSLKSLPDEVNSVDAEFGHTIRDNQLIFSSLRADSVNSKEEAYSKQYKTRLYKSKIEKGEFNQNERIDALMIEKLNSGNGTFSLDGSRYYFSLCEDESFNYKCKILVSNYQNGVWSKIDTLNHLINEKGKNSTMPFITKLNEKEVLFFASDRTGTKGGLDIWVADVNGSKIGDIQNLSEINTIDNDLSPWFDTTANRLYFSSSWHYGFGGQDVFSTDYPFSKIENIGQPTNSPANDLYFFKHKDTIYVSSNRLGTRYSKNPTCCSDIFVKYPLIKKSDIVSSNTIDSLNTYISTSIKKKLPVKLYFQNDRPNPDSWEATTKLNYMSTYKVYQENFEIYKSEVGKGLNLNVAQMKILDLEYFFKNDVDKGAKDLIEFTELIAKELASGSRVIITIKGFASPIAKTQYNVNLTKRRISSLVNFFNEYNYGELKNYLNGSALNGAKLSFEFVPFGEFSADQTTSDDFYNQKESVYSKEASIERKLHIEEVTFEKGKQIFPLIAKNYVFNAGVRKKGEAIINEFTLINQSDELVIIKINSNESELSLLPKSYSIEPKSSLIIPFTLNTSKLIGFNRKSFQIQVGGFENQLELFITTEIK
jgi:hypothetical protein